MNNMTSDQLLQKAKELKEEKIKLVKEEKEFELISPEN